MIKDNKIKRGRYGLFKSQYNNLDKAGRTH